MKKWMNTLFLGSLFIAAALIETYSIFAFDGNLFSTIGLGVVVMITGYLFMDTVRSELKQGKDEAKFYIDRVFGEETEKWSERYTELLNLQKASYSATKKNTSALAQQFEEVLSRLQDLEENNAKALHRITELQKKSLEGQKNALNLEVHHNNENTKRILSILSEEDRNNEILNQLERILTQLERNNELLQSRVNETESNGWREPSNAELGFMEENASESDWSLEEEPEPEADHSLAEPVEADEAKVVPLYDDPNKKLTTDEIASLFASFGK